MFDLDPFPERLVVVGGGYIACEFASIFNGLGAAGDPALPRRADPARLRRRRARLPGAGDAQAPASTSASTAEVARDRRATRAAASAGDAARRPAARGRHRALRDRPRAEHAGPRPGSGRRRARRADGAVVVDEHYRSSVPSIYALGDVIDRGAAHAGRAGRGDGAGRRACSARRPRRSTTTTSRPPSSPIRTSAPAATRRRQRARSSAQVTLYPQRIQRAAPHAVAAAPSAPS